MTKVPVEMRKAVVVRREHPSVRVSGGSRRTKKHARDETDSGRAEGQVAAFLKSQLSKGVFDARSRTVTPLEPKGDHRRYKLEDGGGWVCENAVCAAARVVNS